MSGYCPAGKCECDDFDNTDHFCNFADSLMNTLWKQCPRKNSRAEGLRVAVEAVEKIAESHPDINVNAENGWVKLSVILAAIDAVKGE